jgi:hypothetical protein
VARAQQHAFARARSGPPRPVDSHAARRLRAPGSHSRRTPHAHAAECFRGSFLDRQRKRHTLIQDSLSVVEPSGAPTHTHLLATARQRRHRVTTPTYPHPRTTITIRGGARPCYDKTHARNSFCPCEQPTTAGHSAATTHTAHLETPSHTREVRRRARAAAAGLANRARGGRDKCAQALPPRHRGRPPARALAAQPARVRSSFASLFSPEFLLRRIPRATPGPQRRTAAPRATGPAARSHTHKYRDSESRAAPRATTINLNFLLLPPVWHEPSRDAAADSRRQHRVVCARAAAAVSQLYASVTRRSDERPVRGTQRAREGCGERNPRSALRFHATRAYAHTGLSAPGNSRAGDRARRPVTMRASHGRGPSCYNAARARAARAPWSGPAPDCAAQAPGRFARMRPRPASPARPAPVAASYLTHLQSRTERTTSSTPTAAPNQSSPWVATGRHFLPSSDRHRRAPAGRRPTGRPCCAVRRRDARRRHRGRGCRGPPLRIFLRENRAATQALRACARTTARRPWHLQKRRNRVASTLRRPRPTNQAFREMLLRHNLRVLSRLSCPGVV